MFRKAIMFVAVAGLVFGLSPVASAQFSTGFEAGEGYAGQGASAGEPGGPTQLVPQQNWIQQPGWDSNYFDVHTYAGAQIPWTPQKVEAGAQLYPVAPRPMPVNPTGGAQFIALGTSDNSGGGRNLLEVGYTPGLVEVSADYCAGFDGDYAPRQGQLRYGGTDHAHPGLEIYTSDGSTDEFKWAFNVTAAEAGGATLDNNGGYYRFDGNPDFDDLPREQWYRIGMVVDLDPGSATYRRILEFKSQKLVVGQAVVNMTNPQALYDDGSGPALVDMYLRDGAAGTFSPTHLGFYNVGNGSLSMFDNAYVGAPYDWPDVVPEPATMSLLALGGLALLRRRRRS